MKNMPGFTADTSLYKTSGCYQSVTTQRYSSGEQWVISQIRAGVGGGISIGGGQVVHASPFECASCLGLCGEHIADVDQCLAICKARGDCYGAA